MFSKIEVNGDGACDLYRFLKAARPEPDGTEDIPWNFTKFLVDGDGQVITRYAPPVSPEEVEKDLAPHLSGS